MNFKILGALFIAIALSGCATLFGDNTRTVRLTSDPSGATVYMNGIAYGQTPMFLNLPTYVYNGQTIVFRKHGYQDTATLISSSFQNVGLWNLLFFPGFLVDAATGNTVKINPSELNTSVTLAQ